MKNLLLLFFLLIVCNAQAWDQREPNPIQSCQVHSPYGFARTTHNVLYICREAYLVAYDPTAKIPNYVAYTLLPQNALGCVTRSNAFSTDSSIQNGASPNDYVGTGYDKGHAAPAADLSWNRQVEYESFLMTNMYPQHGSLNRGIWKLLETSVRGWVVQQNQSFTIFVGAIYNGNIKIGNGVVVPHDFYKIVINNTTGAIAGWIFPHVAPYKNLGTDLTKFRISISRIQQQAGVQFFFPANSKELLPGSEWPANFRALTHSKRNLCAN